MKLRATYVNWLILRILTFPNEALHLSYNHKLTLSKDGLHGCTVVNTEC